MNSEEQEFIIECARRYTRKGWKNDVPSCEGGNFLEEEIHVGKYVNAGNNEAKGPKAGRRERKEDIRASRALILLLPGGRKRKGRRGCERGWPFGGARGREESRGIAGS
ncbi:hypothetical protein KM043_007260 [Ampulex compressa]|nr:hypothetical protein KM043_007260 [Ampulex compressa]